MLVIVTGSRDFADSQQIHQDLEKLDIETLYHGACPTGADAIAHDWCLKRKIPVQTFPAKWREHGRAAGPIRNAEMIKHVKTIGQVKHKKVLVLAYKSDPISKGTDNTITLAKEAGLTIVEFVKQ